MGISSVSKSIGVGQSWQTVSRDNGVTYTNTTGRAIFVSILARGGASATPTLNIGGLSSSRFSNQFGDRVINGWLGGLVPAGATYVTSGLTVTAWQELR
jgi:hypothetical protein